MESFVLIEVIRQEGLPTGVRVLRFVHSLSLNYPCFDCFSLVRLPRLFFTIRRAKIHLYVTDVVPIVIKINVAREYNLTLFCVCISALVGARALLRTRKPLMKCEIYSGELLPCYKVRFGVACWGWQDN